MRILNFEKTSEGRWFVALPEWTGPKEDLEMVWGADMLLDIYAQGSNQVTLSVSETVFPDHDRIDLVEICSTIEGGAYYYVNQIKGVDYNFKIWLCDVTKFLFGEFPEALWFQDCTL